MITSLTVALLLQAGAPDVERLPIPRETTAERTARLLPVDPPSEGLTFSKVAWRIGGVWAGLPTGLVVGVVALGVPSALAIKAISDQAGSVALGAALGAGALGLVVGGVLGFELGGLAADGRRWARILLIVLDAVGLPLLMGGLVGLAASAGGGG